MKARISLHDLSPKFQAQAVAQLHASPRPRTLKIEVADAPAAKRRMRQSAAPLNKTETAFREFLAQRFAGYSVLSQSVTLKLANGCRYTPDFIVPAGLLPMHAYEVKGFMRDDAGVKLKVAASLYPWIKFHLVTRLRNGAWDVQEVLA